LDFFIHVYILAERQPKRQPPKIVRLWNLEREKREKGNPLTKNKNSDLMGISPDPYHKKPPKNLSFFSVFIWVAD